MASKPLEVRQIPHADYEIDLNFDPCPDLMIEVVNKSDSDHALPIYAALGVPEVWSDQVREKGLWFGRLIDQTFEDADHSLFRLRSTGPLMIDALEVRTGSRPVVMVPRVKGLGKGVGSRPGGWKILPTVVAYS